MTKMSSISMCSMISNSELSLSSESKYYNMKQFIRAVGEYIRMRTEDTASLINRYLQLLSVSIDYSIFDPNTSIVCEFFVSLHELLNSLEPRSALAWCCVNVLGIASKNSAARNQLIHTYEFIPVLSRLLGDYLTPEKRIRLLAVMQELSCGIKISWQIPHLAHLMTTLAKWVEKEPQQEVVMLSLGVLVNLCYKNLPAIYTLTRCVDTKQFLRCCTNLKGVQMEFNVSKLMLILDSSAPEETYIRLIMSTFTSVQEAFTKKDAILLRHIVELYLDVTQKQNNRNEVDHNGVSIDYASKVEQLLNLVDNNASGDSAQHNPECMFYVFKFLNSLLITKMPQLAAYYPQCVGIALRWIQTDFVCSEALTMLRRIIEKTEVHEPKILELLLTRVPIFLLGIESVKEDAVMHIEHCSRLSAVMLLLRVLVQYEGTRERVMAALNEQNNICNIFVPLIGSKESHRSRPVDANNCSPEAVSLYITTLVLVHELTQWDVRWSVSLASLLQYRQIHSVLAEAFYSGTAEIKELILSMTSSEIFPRKQVSAAMCDLQSLVQRKPQVSNSTAGSSENNLMCYPMITIAQSIKLDDTIDTLKEVSKSNKIGKISDVMELYEYKLASMGHAERAAMASVDAASQRCTHLQHQIAQLTTEMSRLRQILMHTQQCSEELNAQNKLLERNNSEYDNRLMAEKGRCRVAQSQIATKEKKIAEMDRQFKELNEKLKEEENANFGLKDNLAKMKEVVEKLQGNIKKQEKNVEKKDEIIATANSTLERCKMQVAHLEQELKQSEIEWKKQNDKLIEKSNELAEKTRLLESITLAIAQSKK